MTNARSSGDRRLLLALAPALLRLATALVTGAVLSVVVPIVLARSAAPHVRIARSFHPAPMVTAPHAPEPPTLTLLALGVAAMIGAAAHGSRQGAHAQEDW
jgi:hypothetical protein